MIDRLAIYFCVTAIIIALIINAARVAMLILMLQSGAGVHAS
jgi:hypothetical protein